MPNNVKQETAQLLFNRAFNISSTKVMNQKIKYFKS